jgi:hypothetical protein
MFRASFKVCFSMEEKIIRKGRQGDFKRLKRNIQGR